MLGRSPETAHRRDPDRVEACSPPVGAEGIATVTRASHCCRASAAVADVVGAVAVPVVAVVAVEAVIQPDSFAVERIQPQAAILRRLSKEPVQQSEA